MLPSDNGAAIPSHKSPQIHTFPPKCHEWNFWIDGLTHSLGFPNYQYEVSKVEVHPFFAIRHQKQLALVFGEAEAGRSDVSNGRKGLCKKCCTFFVGKRLKLQKLWWYFNSWLQFYDFNSLLQSSKIVLKVGEPSTKMLLHSLWTAQIQSSLKGPYCCLQFIGSLGCLKLYGPPFLQCLTWVYSTQIPIHPCPEPPNHHVCACFPSISSHTFCQVTIGCWKAPASWGSRNSTPLSTRQGRYQKASQLQNHVLVVLMSYQLKFNRFKWWIGGVHERTQIHIVYI